MLLRDYIRKEGVGIKTRLHRESGVARPTIDRAERLEPLRLRVAEALSKATAGEVTVWELLNPQAFLGPSPADPSTLPAA